MASVVLVVRAASMVFAEAAVGMFGGVRFSSVGAARAAVKKRATAASFMIEYVSGECELSELLVGMSTWGIGQC